MRKIILLSMVIILLSGCSSTNGQPKTPHYLAPDAKVPLAKEEREKIEGIDDVFTKALEDGAKLIIDNKKSQFTDEELNNYKKYFVWDNNIYLANKLLGSMSNTMDGYDGNMTYTFDKWIDIITERIYDCYIPLPSLKDWYGGESYYDESIFSNVMKKSSELSDDEQVTYFESFDKYTYNLGLLDYEKNYKHLREYTEREHGDASFVKVYGVKFVYVYESDYPKNEDDIDTHADRREKFTTEQVNAYSAKPCNTLDILLVETNDGWKILECKWLIEDIHNVVDIPEVYED